MSGPAISPEPSLQTSGGPKPARVDVVAEFESGFDDPTESWPGPKGGLAHRPQALVFSFFGGVVGEDKLPPIPTAVYLRLFGRIGIAEAAARAALARMVRKGLLDRQQEGRTAHYRLTPTADELVRRATGRVLSTTPFEHPDGEWTLLSYSMPESRRDLRHKLRATLAWSGFGGVRDGLWIAPGEKDVTNIFAAAGLTEILQHADWFAASPMPGVELEKLIRRAWPVDQIRSAHDYFIRQWSSQDASDPLGKLTVLGADWLRLLRMDPGLPARYLSNDWPSEHSTALFHERYRALLPGGKRALRRELGLPDVLIAK